MHELTRRSIAWGRVYYAAFAIFVAGVLTYYFARYLHNTAEMIAVIAAVFSILAGVLIAVVSILGDPGMLMDQSWRYNYLASKEIQRKLHRNIDIFVLYIVILIALFIFAMITDKASKFYAIMQGTMFFLCAVGFFASVSLPFSLVRIQRDRLDAAIKSAKSKTPTP